MKGLGFIRAFRVEGSGFRVYKGSRFRVQGVHPPIFPPPKPGVRVQGLGEHLAPKTRHLN